MTTPERLAVSTADGHRYDLIACVPTHPQRCVLWLPALGVQAKHYLPLANALAANGVAVFLHEWRGHGSSDIRPSRQNTWGYREILQHDVPASVLAARQRLPTQHLTLGGHSLGGQLACCYAALHPQLPEALWLVASGTPGWHAFPAPRRYLLPLAYQFLPAIAKVQGVLHGHALGFGGTEARGLIADWAAVGLSQRFAANGLPIDLEQGMAAVTAPVTAIVMANDWLAPPSSMRALVGKLGGQVSLTTLDTRALGTAADHFAWMKSPQKVASLLHCKNN